MPVEEEGGSFWRLGCPVARGGVILRRHRPGLAVRPSPDLLPSGGGADGPAKRSLCFTTTSIRLSVKSMTRTPTNTNGDHHGLSLMLCPSTGQQAQEELIANSQADLHGDGVIMGDPPPPPPPARGTMSPRPPSDGWMEGGGERGGLVLKPTHRRGAHHGQVGSCVEVARPWT